jgi:hypothetical protein
MGARSGTISPYLDTVMASRIRQAFAGDSAASATNRRLWEETSDLYTPELQAYIGEILREEKGEDA